MISAEKTGKSRKVWHDRGFWVKEYQIKVEWWMSGSVSLSDLYRKSSPGAYPGGTCVAQNVMWYYIEGWWDPDFGWEYYAEYRHYNWAQAGTWYYMAEHSSDEVNETVP